MSERREFLEVIEASEAHRRFRAALDLRPSGRELVALAEAAGRVLAIDVVAGIDVPGFDRSNVDGFAVIAADTFGATEAEPKRITLRGTVIEPGRACEEEITTGHAIEIATGGVMPRGADAVIMIEHVEVREGAIEAQRAVTPGNAVSFAGSDIARGECVVRAGVRLTARETGTIAALGRAEVEVYRRPRIGVISTGNEIIPPGERMRPGLIYDSNLRIIADTLREIGCDPVDLGIVVDDPELLRERVRSGLELDGVVLSGGTSKGGGDFSARVVEELATIVCHGVAVKPGKPLCLAAYEGKPVVVLPGFPTSAVFTFHEFVVPVLAELSGAPRARTAEITARLPMRVDLDSGRSEFLLVTLLEGKSGWVAYPMGKGSGSVTSFARADGFITFGRHEEFVEADTDVSVRLIGRDVRPADLVVIGSHCVGLDRILSRLSEKGFTAKSITVGSQGGFRAAERGECDVAGVHLCDENGVYNTPFMRGEVDLERGYGRQQGIVYRKGEPKPDPRDSVMINRNRGSGTRVLIDELLRQAGALEEGAPRPHGYHYQAKSHAAVAAAVSQGRADWGVAIESVARSSDLQFEPLREEQYDFLIVRERRARPAVRAFLAIVRNLHGRWPEAR